jgi:hypothetical protein
MEMMQLLESTSSVNLAAKVTRMSMKIGNEKVAVTQRRREKFGRTCVVFVSQNLE